MKAGFSQFASRHAFANRQLTPRFFSFFAARSYVFAIAHFIFWVANGYPNCQQLAVGLHRGF
jgi:hypothetical protein